MVFCLANANAGILRIEAINDENALALLLFAVSNGLCRRAPPNFYLRLLDALQSEDITEAEIGAIIGQDLRTTAKFLQFGKFAALRLPKPYRHSGASSTNRSMRDCWRMLATKGPLG